MKERYTLGDLQNPEEMWGLLSRVKTRVIGTISEQAELMMQDREACNQRGYHRVGSNDKDPLICYDCELWFGKDQGISYRVEPL